MANDNNIFYFDVPANMSPIVKTNRIVFKQYRSSNSSWDKIKYIIGAENRALSAKEIILWIYQLEPDLRNKPEKTKKRVENNVYSILSNYSKEGKVIRFKSKKTYKYAFSIWLNKERKIKNEYLI